MAHERVISSKMVFEGRVVNLRLDTMELDGQTFEREIVQHLGAVAMIPFDDQGNVILVRQYRAGAASELLELPAGSLEPGEDRVDCARRELQEEIGMIPDTLEKLGEFWVAASYTTELITIYIARGLKPSKLEADHDERIEVVTMPFEQALHMALANEIIDSKTLIGLMWAAHQRA